MIDAPVCHIDVETFSEVDIRKAGAHRYARDPSTECLILAYRLDDPCLGEGSLEHWDLTTGAPMPADLSDMIADREVTLAAFNAGFEMAILEHCLGIEFDPSRWICAQALALSYGFPASLGGVSDALGMTGDSGKMREGQALIRKFSIPQPRTGARVRPADDPAAWGRFIEYCRRDVVVEAEIMERLS